MKPGHTKSRPDLVVSWILLVIQALYFAIPGVHSILMVQGGCWSASHHKPFPGRRIEEQRDEKIKLLPPFKENSWKFTHFQLYLIEPIGRKLSNQRMQLQGKLRNVPD